MSYDDDLKWKLVKSKPYLVFINFYSKMFKREGKGIANIP